MGILTLFDNIAPYAIQAKDVPGTRRGGARDHGLVVVVCMYASCGFTVTTLDEQLSYVYTTLKYSVVVHLGIYMYTVQNAR